jgi:uncharacterized membrane protein YtjA (UPF0391 family)
MAPRRFERFPLCVRIRRSTRHARWHRFGQQKDFPARSFFGSTRSIIPCDEEHAMLYYAVVFLIIAIIAGFFGFFGVAGLAAGIAKILFVIFIILFILSLIFGRRRRLP